MEIRLTEAIVLAGGLGSRLATVVGDVPKPMAPINKRPFLDILLSNLSRKGFKSIILSVGYMAEKIQDYFGDSKYGLDITYHKELKPLGTGGAIRSSLEMAVNESVFVLNGDTYIDVEFDLLRSVWDEFRLPVIVTRNVAGNSRFDSIIAENHLVQSFGGSRISSRNSLVNAGVYLLPKNIFKEFDHVRARSFSFESDFLPAYARNKSLYSLNCDRYFIDIGVPKDFKRAQKELEIFLDD